MLLSGQGNVTYISSRPSQLPERVAKRCRLLLMVHPASNGQLRGRWPLATPVLWETYELHEFTDNNTRAHPQSKGLELLKYLHN